MFDFFPWLPLPLVKEGDSHRLRRRVSGVSVADVWAWGSPEGRETAWWAGTSRTIALNRPGDHPEALNRSLHSASRLRPDPPPLHCPASQRRQPKATHWSKAQWGTGLKHWKFKTEMMYMGLYDEHIPVATPQACCPLRPRSVSSYGQTAASSSSSSCPSSSLRLPGWYVPLVDGQRVYSSSCHSNMLVTWRQAYRVKLYLMRINDVILISADLNDVSTLLRLTEINPANFRILF